MQDEVAERAGGLDPLFDSGCPSGNVANAHISSADGNDFQR
ncbi:MAG TPA: hypothetical protein VG674_26985 [Amycolatopsis sp.]|nr:hypothetical protein [Amycolatopsis sp.]